MGIIRNTYGCRMEASTHIHDVASGEHEGIDRDAMRAIPVLKTRGVFVKIGQAHDIHTNTMLQWRKWERFCWRSCFYAVARMSIGTLIPGYYIIFQLYKQPR